MAFTLNDIIVYIFNWKKVTDNSLKLYEKISPIIKDTCIVNCDETRTLDASIQHIQLDDSCYYGSQYDHAIKHVKENNIMCCIVGDNIHDNDFNKIFNSAIYAYNTVNAGVYAPNDKRSMHTTKLEHIKDELYDVITTDCGFWFIHPKIVKKLKNINYNVSRFGWGVDTITITESRKQGLLVMRDYSTETDQVDHSCGYDAGVAYRDMKKLERVYKKLR
jgi:hypothetical protein